MSDSDYSRVARVIRHLEEQAEDQPDLARLASLVGLSPFHVQRMFHRWAGITPKAFLQCLTLARAKAQLAEARSLLEASQAVGLSGTGRLHDLFLSLEAMTPGDYKRGGAGLVLRWGLHPTPFGPALFTATPRGLCGLAFVDGDPGPALAEVQAAWPGAVLREDPAATAPLAREVDARMSGGTPGPLALVLKGSPFQVQVWKALLRIPEGRLASYQVLADLAGHPGAARAAGGALAANPIAYLIPCHRVIRSTGAVGDYHWGSERKRLLLAVEGARALAG
ncbi:methylated-DNA--[protein]-cysteine S-methyltransferase [Mesoterricola sediminis]|uniref:methylated-DNA--[protein]-cysteine S-methyltransferase n=1 Tax=Mesoterricola sediminis TaxID=2927980 RepID=A0AA48H675_9BACT|nr:methylated-DNA--[protein]-cysteine S-methyltransferase [Mesoterricola sediminis]BDU78121.1 methylated-DNA--protein-cysteine methyltransferase [Mesoterricola sediminis]